MELLLAHMMADVTFIPHCSFFTYETLKLAVRKRQGRGDDELRNHERLAYVPTVPFRMDTRTPL